METVIAGLLKDFEDGKMTRRQLIQSLALAAAAAVPGASAMAQTAAPQPKPPIPQAFEPAPWKTVWLDHISFAVSDYRKSTAFGVVCAATGNAQSCAIVSPGYRACPDRKSVV